MNAADPQDLMDQDFIPITTGEIKARKEWLICFWTYFGMTFVGYIIGCKRVFSYLLNAASLQQDILWKAIIILFSMTLCLISVLISYHFVYKKRSVFWLIWLMSAIPTSIILSICDPSFKVGLFHSNLFHPDWSYLLNLVDIYFWASCIKLFKFNRVHKNKVREERQKTIKNQESPL